MSDIEAKIKREMISVQSKLQKKINAHLKKLKQQQPPRGFDREKKKLIKYYKADWDKRGWIDWAITDHLKPYKHLYTHCYSRAWTYTERKGNPYAPSDWHVYPEIYLHLDFVRETIKPRKYTVICGETLGDVSKAVYGTESYAREISKSNKDFKACKINNFVYAKEISLPKVDVPAALLFKQPVMAPKQFLDLSFLNQVPAFSTTIKKVALGPRYVVTPMYSLKFSGAASLTLTAKRSASRVPASFSVDGHSKTYAQSLSRIDFGFQITDWSAKSLTCTSSVSTKAFKLRGKMSIDGAFEMSVSSIPISFSKDGWDISGTMSISGKVLIIPRPPKNAPIPWYAKAADFVSDHAFEGVLVVGCVLAAPTIISATAITATALAL